MFFKPFLLGNKPLSQAALAADKKSAFRAGLCAVGQKCLYLSSFNLPRMQYVQWDEVERVFKRVALSKGGFSGRGAFASITYLVVRLRDGREKQCYCKYENEVDLLLEKIGEIQPEIPLHSKQAKEKMDEKLRREASLEEKALPPEAAQAVKRLREDLDFLNLRPRLWKVLQYSASKKRTQETLPVSRRVLGYLLLTVCVVLFAGGFILLQHNRHFAPYCFLFGFAFLFFTLSGNLLPLGKNSKRRLDADWESAVRQISNYLLEREQFFCPAVYAHPDVISLMIVNLQFGRALNEQEALDCLKSDLRQIDSSVTLDEDIYKKVVAVKPLFIVNDYR